jgi:hypothetical protein
MKYDTNFKCIRNEVSPEESHASNWQLLIAWWTITE